MRYMVFWIELLDTLENRGQCSNSTVILLIRAAAQTYIILLQARSRRSVTWVCPCGVSWPSGLVHWTQVLVRMWVRIPAWPVAALVSLGKTLNHKCFILRMGHKAVGPVCCVMHVKEPRTLIVKEKGLAPVFLDSRLEHPSGWICACYKSSVLLLLLLLLPSFLAWLSMSALVPAVPVA